MQTSNLDFDEWILSISNRALQRAYQASKGVRIVQKEYLYSRSFGHRSRHSWQTMALYVDAALNYLTAEIFWRLLEFKISQAIIKFMIRSSVSNLIDRLFFKKQNLAEYSNRFGASKFTKVSNKDSWTIITRHLFHLNNPDVLRKTDLSFSEDVFEPKKVSTNEVDSSETYRRSNNLQSLFTARVERQLAWIEATLADLDTWRRYRWMPSPFMNEYAILSNNELLLGLSPKSRPIAYESVGLIPRSITRTLSRFQTELAGQSTQLILPEFRLAKYQAVASLQYVTLLVLIPCLFSGLCNSLIVEPIIAEWWDHHQSQVFINSSQEDRALRRLQEVEELLWLDLITANPLERQPGDVISQIHLRTIELVEGYNQDSIHTLVHLFTDFLSVICISCLFVLGKKRLAVLNSWVQELFYSLSDTMKAFFILLLTDLCIGFHSPHGWEIFVGALLEHFGFSHNKQIISCFVSTFPVILDTVFKYWIFRHLNRISPSIVVSYHTMNE